MPYVPASTRTQVYLQFQRRDDDDYHGMVFFYENNESTIHNLSFDQRLEILYAYNEALFQTGAYKRHLSTSKTLADWSLIYNIVHYQNENLLEFMLFQRIASLYNLGRFAEALELSKKLMKIAPHQPINVSLYARMLRTSYVPLLRKIRALAVSTFILTALIIVIELLVVRTIYPQWTPWVEIIRISTFVIGVTLLGGFEIGAYVWAEQAARRYAKSLQKKP